MTQEFVALVIVCAGFVAAICLVLARIAAAIEDVALAVREDTYRVEVDEPAVAINSRIFEDAGAHEWQSATVGATRERDTDKP